MAKISTYPSADVPLQLSDRLIGTEAFRPVPSPTPLATKNFSLGELLQLFSANFPAASLQAVLDTGNTATQNITLTGTISSTLIKPVNIEDTSGSQGLTFQVLSKGTSSINWVDIPVDNLQAVLNKGNTATQNITLVGNITSTKIIPGNIQDELGFVGTTGQFLSKTATGIKWVNTPASTTPTLGDVVSVGNIANQDIFISDLRIGKGPGTGTQNSLLGYRALEINTTGYGSLAVGAFTLSFNTTGNRNTAVGYASLYTNISGNLNTSVGIFSQYLSTTGIANVSLGYGTLQNNIIGNFNTALGYRTLLNNKADKNTAIGAETMFINQTGTFNTVVGQEALRASVAGSYNSIVGNFAILNAEASYVSALGRDAGRFSSAGNLITANESIFIGFNSKSLNTSSTNEIVIGANAVGEGDNTVTIGHTTITSTRLRGAVKGGSFVKDGGLATQYLMADGSVTTGVGTGTVTSVGLSMPSAFNVTPSTITTSGIFAVTGAGVASQYIRGDGTLATFPTSTGGGASVSYYLNGSVSQGTIGGVAYKEMNSVPVIGAGTDFTINADGYIAQFITDVGDPNKLLIPAGNWNFETYFSASSNGGTPRFYIELYKYNGTTFTLIASNSANPEFITGGTSIDLYFSALAVPATTLTVTDRLAVRFYVIHSGRTITMHTENSHLCEVITTFSTGLTALNGLTSQVQYFAVGTSGADFNISSVTDTHTFNLPTASAINRGALSSTDWSTFNGKQNTITLTTTGNSGSSTLIGNTLNIPIYTLSGLGGVPTSRELTINGTTYDLSANRSWTITASGKSVNVVSINTDAGSASSTDYVYLASGTISITLPTAVGNQNLYTIKNVGTGVITINTLLSQTIDGSLTAPIRVQYLSLTIISDGANWNII